MAAFTALALLSACSTSDDGEPPACPVSRSGGVDIVPSGVRPCVLYGSGGKAAADQDSGRAAIPGGAAKQSKAPAAPKVPLVKAPAPKAPAAPAPKAPAPAPRIR